MNKFEFEFNKKVKYKGETFYCKMKNYKGEVLIEKSFSIPESFWGDLWVNLKELEDIDQN